MIATIWTIITGNPIARLIAKIALGVLAVLTFGMLKKREGAAGAKAKRDIQDLKGFKETTERIQDADAAMGDDPAVLRDSLRKRDTDKR